MRKYIIYIVIAIVFIVLFLFFSPVLSSFRSNIFGNFEVSIDKAGKDTSNGFHDLLNFRNLSSENRKLREENAKLKAEVEKSKIYQDDNEKLRSLLDLTKKIKKKSIPAEVCGRDISDWFFRFEINKGSKHGIKKDMIVISDCGLVGQIISVNSNTSNVRTIMHNQSLIPVYIVESGAFALLDGEGDKSCSLRYIYNSSLLESGQLVVTSGLGDVYPEGLVIGSTLKSTNGEYIVETFCDIKTISKVLVVENKK